MMKSQNSTFSQLSVQILVSGRVQGVGFRRFVQKQAQAMQVQGWVRNLFDGRVEVRAKGPQNLLDLFFEKVKKGPAFAHVEFITINPVDDFVVEGNGFEVVADGEFR